MPPDLSKPEGYAIDKNHLHIWPRTSFMLIGLPNKVSQYPLIPFSEADGTCFSREDHSRLPSSCRSRLSKR
jgi:hypothetical protein